MKKLKQKQNQDKFISKLELQYLEKEYQLLNQIGRGSFAKVIKAKQRFGCQQIRAIKRIQVNPLMDQINEISNLKVLSNDHVIQFYGYIIENNQLNIIMQFCKGSLRDQIMSTKKFTPEKLLCLIVQVTNAMIALNNKKIMHLDLKPQNILFEQENHYRLCDFGCSQLFGSISNLKPNISGYTIKITQCLFGTPQYIAPQIQLNKNSISLSSCDIWSFGIILYEIIYKKHPFHLQKNGKVDTQEFRLFLQGKYQIDYPKVDPNYPIELMKLMLKPHPAQRISWNKVKLYLIQNYGKHEAQFTNLREAAKKQINLVLVLEKVVDIIRQNLSNLEQNEQNWQDYYSFWRQYCQQLLELKAILVKISHAQIVKFCDVFHYKMKNILNPQTYLNFKFVLDHVAEQKAIVDQLGIDLIQKQESIEELEDLLRQSISKLKVYLAKSDSKDEQMNKLKIFMQQASNIKGMFCKGDEFKKSCQIFDIKQQQ